MENAALKPSDYMEESGLVHTGVSIQGVGCGRQDVVAGDSAMVTNSHKEMGSSAETRHEAAAADLRLN